MPLRGSVCSEHMGSFHKVDAATARGVLAATMRQTGYRRNNRGKALLAAHGAISLEIKTSVARIARRRTVPIIAVTSYALSSDEANAHAAGCDDFVPKPYSP